MRVISKKAILQFIEKHPDSKSVLLSWYALASGCRASDLSSLRDTFNSADYVPPQYTVFNVGGNKYRVITAIHYNVEKMFIREVLTHAEYDEWTRNNRRK